jgi:transposase-like protein
MARPHFWPVRLLAGQSVQELASDLHLTPAQLLQDLRNGESLEEIAARQGVSQEQLQTDVMQIIHADLSRLVQDKRITQAQADRVEQRVQANLPALLNDDRLLSKVHSLRMHQAMLAEAARIIGITKEQLVADMKQGQSIAQIAKAHGVPEQTLVQKLAQWVGQQAAPNLRQWVESTHIATGNSVADSGSAT